MNTFESNFQPVFKIERVVRIHANHNSSVERINENESDHYGEESFDEVS